MSINCWLKKRINTGSNQPNNQPLPEHDGGGERQLDEGGEVAEREHGEPLPRLRKAPGDEVADLRGDDEPPGDVPDDGGAKESVPQARDDDVVEDDVDGEPGAGDGGDHPHPALRLEELLQREVGGVREQLRGHPARVGARHARDVAGLPERAEDGRREEVRRGEDHRRGAADEPGPLDVHAQHGHLASAHCLPA